MCGVTLAELRWRSVLDQAAGPVAIVDQRGWFVYVNPALCDMLGYDAEHLTRCAASELVYPGDPMLDSDAFARTLPSSENSIEMEKRFVRADGSILWAHVTSSLILHGEEPLFLSQLHDITARREVEQLWWRTMSHAPIGMALLDVEGRWTEVNDKLCELVGYRREELVGRHFLSLTYSTDDDGMDALAELLSGRRDVLSLEKRYRHGTATPSGCSSAPAWFPARGSRHLDWSATTRPSVTR